MTLFGSPSRSRATAMPRPAEITDTVSDVLDPKFVRELAQLLGFELAQQVRRRRSVEERKSLSEFDTSMIRNGFGRRPAGTKSAKKGPKRSRGLYRIPKQCQSVRGWR